MYLHIDVTTALQCGWLLLGSQLAQQAQPIVYGFCIGKLASALASLSRSMEHGVLASLWLKQTNMQPKCSSWLKDVGPLQLAVGDLVHKT